MQLTAEQLLLSTLKSNRAHRMHQHVQLCPCHRCIPAFVLRHAARLSCKFIPTTQ
jgi:hypothetical protein